MTTALVRARELGMENYVHLLNGSLIISHPLVPARVLLLRGGSHVEAAIRQPEEVYKLAHK